MEGLVSEVSIVSEAGEDSAPSWPPAQLQRGRLPRRLPEVSSFHFRPGVSQLIQLIMCLSACVRASALVIL